MKKSQLSDKQLEDILRQMPKVKDHRDPRDIYQNIAHRVEKRRLPAWIVPSVATAAVLMLAFILSSGFLDRNQSADFSLDSKSSSESPMEMDSASEKKAVEESADTAKSSLNMDLNDSSKQKSENFLAMNEENSYGGLTALYAEEVEAGNQQILTYATPDENVQMLVPVTVTIPKSEGKTWFDTFTETMPMLREDEWGLSEYYPFEGSLSYSEDTNDLLFKVEEGHAYQHGSTNGPNFLKSVDLNFGGQGLGMIRFETGGQEGIDFGHGTILKDKKISLKQNRAFLIYQTDNNHIYLVPTQEEFSKLEEAFEKMKSGNRYEGTEASIPDKWKMEISGETDSTVIITLKHNEALTEEFLLNLEAILLTAKDFGYEAVKIENGGTKQLGPFNLNLPINVPLAPNKKDIE
ncbi:MAG TPA: hypothetical protein DCR24_11610 [Bacillus bacterium]|nr:hypothetical protein [Bacillus sp. (in: firmicutes)]